MSNKNPSFLKVCIPPPDFFDYSRTTTFLPNLANVEAAANPDAPAPNTNTSICYGNKSFEKIYLVSVSSLN